MSDKQLQSVESFCISHPEFGSVEFAGKTDISGLDLGDLVTIEKQFVEVYQDSRHRKPRVGEKLNKQAVITLRQVKCRAGEDPLKKEDKLRQVIEKSNGQHISYDAVKEEWKFKVEHFTRYGLDEEDEEASHEAPAQPLR
mmetsp:Transcript_38776/g.28667  ORF Transcript_38776/g.28667 Transcript_38776/m.28667 type:complete len:140 (+) Transcript_38776:481-900(+)